MHVNICIYIYMYIYITEETGEENGNCLSCNALYQLCYDVILGTDLIDEECLDSEHESESSANISEGDK